MPPTPILPTSPHPRRRRILHIISPRPLLPEGSLAKFFAKPPPAPHVTNDPPETESLRSGGEPRVCDVCIPSWYPLCSQPEPRPQGLGPNRSGKCSANCTADDQKRQRWGGFLVSRICSTNHFRFRWRCMLTFSSWISSHCLQIRSPTLIRPFLHPDGETVVSSNTHHRPKSGSAPSFLCLPSHKAGVSNLRENMCHAPLSDPILSSWRCVWDKSVSPLVWHGSVI